MGLGQAELTEYVTCDGRVIAEVELTLTLSREPEDGDLQESMGGVEGASVRDHRGAVAVPEAEPLAAG
jgi:hypothetical protein